MDRFTQEERSKLMAKIRGKNTRPEILVRQFLHSKGFRFRLHDKSLPGSPDIKLSKYRTVIFVHGCYWHGHNPCPIFRLPITNVEFWKTKININQKRDEMAEVKLEEMGWKVLVIWECQIRNKDREEFLNNIAEYLRRGINFS